MNTTDPHPTCGHEDCEAWLAGDGTYVTYCLFTAGPLEVAA
ncbi:hypothetical protein [Nocardia sp. NPDC060249]